MMLAVVIMVRVVHGHLVVVVVLAWTLVFGVLVWTCCRRPRWSWYIVDVR